MLHFKVSNGCTLCSPSIGGSIKNIELQKTLFSYIFYHSGKYGNKLASKDTAADWGGSKVSLHPSNMVVALFYTILWPFFQHWVKIFKKLQNVHTKNHFSSGCNFAKFQNFDLK